MNARDQRIEDATNGYMGLAAVRRAALYAPDDLIALLIESKGAEWVAAKAAGG